MPLAFFTGGNIRMTRRFLSALAREPGLQETRLYLNGGPLAAEGETMVRDQAEANVIDADGWPFYRMWNEGVTATVARPVLVLNNDIAWRRGDLGQLASALTGNVGAAYPRFAKDRRGLAGWCFAARPEAWQRIDERYETWYGDHELVLLLRLAGWRTLPMDVNVVHERTATMRYKPGIKAARERDRVLFESKWRTAS